MKALILFDGSKTSQFCLKVACQDAFAANAAQAGKSGQIKSVEALLVTAESAFYDDVITNQVRVYKNRGQLLLDQGIKELERFGEFDLISGRVIQSNQANLTQVLIDQANAWQATTIYMAMDEQRTTSQLPPLKKESAWLSWLGLKRNQSDFQGEFQVNPETPLNTSQIKVKQLLEQSQCRVVLVNTEGVAMRLTYCPPATKPALPERAAVIIGKSNVRRVSKVS